MAVSGKVGAVYRATGSSTVFTGEAMNSDTAKKRYVIANNSKKYWDDTVPVAVKVNGTLRTSGYTVEYPGGNIIFDVPLGTSDVVTVDGSYFPTSQCAAFFNWKLDATQDMKECTTFVSNGWKEYLPVTGSWTATAEGYWADGSFVSQLGQRVIVSLFVDSTSNKRYEGYIELKKNSIQEQTEDIVKENVEFQGTGNIYYHEI